MHIRIGDIVTKLGNMNIIFKIYLEFIFKYIWVHARIFVLTILGLILNLYKPHIYRLIIDEGLILKNMETLLTLSSIFIVCYILESFFSICLTRDLSYLKNRIDYDLSTALYNKILKQDMYFFEKIRSGELIQRVLGEISNITNLFSDLLISLLSQILLIILVIIIMFKINIILTLITLMVIPLIIVHFKFFNRKIRENQFQVRAKTSELTNRLQEHIEGITIIKANHREKMSCLIFSRHLHELIKEHVNRVKLVTINNQVLSFLYTIAPISLLLIGGISVIDGQMTLGSFISFNMYIGKLYNPINAVAKINLEFQKSIVALERFCEIYLFKNEDNTNSKKKKKNYVNEGIHFINVNFSHNNTLIIKNFSYTFQKGKIICIIGKNGIGKSTLIQLICGIYTIKDGNILIDDIPIREIDNMSLRKLFGIALQNAFLFNNMSIAQNLTFGRHYYNEQRIAELADILNITKDIDELDYGYKTLVKRNGDIFSEGQKQKLNIIRALYNDPQILLLDEPTSSIDYETSIKFYEYLKKIREDKIIICVTHKKEMLDFADEVIDLDKMFCNASY
ncbi:peptidase domain-containing ABC transporter [Tepidimicrobium xylanilyticum]|nr:ABC transporter ATP-binding protein [Tepidimicrobium xylanilyticum]GMG96709.1 ABC transporter permease [Tepidimicrobium xylanilyticum]